MKNILHFKINKKVDTCEDIIFFIENLRNYFGEEFHIIATPFDLDCITNKDMILNLDGITYTFEDIDNLVRERKVV